MVEKTKTGVWIDVPPTYDGAEAEIIRGKCGLTQKEMGRQLGMTAKTYGIAERMGRSYNFQSVPVRARLDFLREQMLDAEDRRNRGR